MLRTFPALLVSTCLLIPATLSVSSAHAAPAAAAALDANQGSRLLLNAVREAVRQNPVLADGVGDRALLEGVRRATAQRPDLADSIVSSAQSIRPHLAPQIRQAAQAHAVQMHRPQMQQPAQVVRSPQAIQQTMPPQATPQAMPQTVAAGEAASSSLKTVGKSLIGGLGDHALIGLGVAAAASVGVAAATGGGGGDKEAVPSGESSQEYNNQWGLGAINAAAAYARGGTGAGVLVAVADTGLLVTHQDINGNLNNNGYDFVDNDNDPEDIHGHGTHVAGIIAAEKDGRSGVNMHGVAYNADILPLRVLGPSGGFITDIVDGVNHARAQNAHVYNGSYGPDYSNPSDTIQEIGVADAFLASAYQNAANDGMVLVFSAGNDFDDNPTVAVNPTGSAIYPYIKPANLLTGVYEEDVPGSNYDFSSLEGMLIAVVATQSDGSIASYSNRCGVAADWCIAAPGSGILSTYNNGGYALMSGTSMAAPHVSGAVAVLIDMFPELTPEEIVERIFLAANKSGIYANSAIYGQGFLDLEKATRPLGALSVATGTSVHSGANFALTASNMNLGPAFGDGLRAALVGQKLAVFDSQKAAFLVDLSDFTRAADSHINLDEALRRFRSRFGERTIRLGDGASLSYTTVDLGRHGSMAQDPALGNRDSSMEMAYTQTIGDMRWKMQYNINPSAMFGIHESGGLDANGMMSRDAFAAPYLSFARQGYSMGSAIPLNASFSLNVAAFTGYPLEDEMRNPEERAESYGHMAELAYKAGALKLFTQLGMLTEKQTFLGSRTEGAFDLNSGTQTSFAGLNGAYRMTDSWSLVGSYYHGISSPRLDGQSLFDDISDVRSDSFSLGMLGNDVFREGDRFGILGNQPLRVTDGDATLSLATGRDRSGMLYKQAYDVNLAPTGRELNLEAFYHLNLPDTQTQLMSSVMYRSEPGHVAAAPDEGLLLLQVQQPF